MNNRTTMPSARATWLVLVLIVVGIVLAYSNSFNNGFHLDDSYGLVNNPYIRSLAQIPQYFIDPFTLTTWSSNTDYRPLLQITYAINYAVSGYDPWSWHVLNLLLHSWVAFCVYLLGRKLFGRGRMADISWLSEAQGDMAAVIAAAIFAVHPITAGVCNYMWARSSLLTAAFALPAVILYLRALHRGAQWKTFLVPLLVYTCALLTKAEAVSVVAVVFLADVLFASEHRDKPIVARLLNSRMWVRVLPFVMLTIAYLILRQVVLPDFVEEARRHSDMTWYAYLFTQFRAWWYYIGQFLAPVNLVADNLTFPVSGSIFEPRVVFALSGWILVGVMLLKMIRTAPAVAFLGGSFFLYLAPHSSVAPLAEMVNEHRPYLPDTGLFLLAGIGLVLIVWRISSRPRLAATVAALIIAIPLILMTRDRNTVWQDSYTYWADVVAKTPNSSRAQMNFGLELMQRGVLEDAEYRFRTAVRLSPWYDLAYINLAIVLDARGDAATARQVFDQAEQIVLQRYAGSELPPSASAVYYWRGKFHLQHSEYDTAIADLSRAAKLTKAPVRELALLAEAQLAAGRVDEAMQSIDQGSEIDPESFADLRRRALEAQNAGGVSGN